MRQALAQRQERALELDAARHEAPIHGALDALPDRLEEQQQHEGRDEGVEHEQVELRADPQPERGEGARQPARDEGQRHGVAHQLAQVGHAHPGQVQVARVQVEKGREQGADARRAQAPGQQVGAGPDQDDGVGDRQVAQAHRVRVPRRTGRGRVARQHQGRSAHTRQRPDARGVAHRRVLALAREDARHQQGRRQPEPDADARQASAAREAAGTGGSQAAECHQRQARHHRSLPPAERHRTARRAPGAKGEDQGGEQQGGAVAPSAQHGDEQDRCGRSRHEGALGLQRLCPAAREHRVPPWEVSAGLPERPGRTSPPLR